MQGMQFSSGRIQNDPLNLFDDSLEMSAVNSKAFQRKWSLQLDSNCMTKLVCWYYCFLQEVFYLGQNVQQCYDSSEIPSVAICNL